MKIIIGIFTIFMGVSALANEKYVKEVNDEKIMETSSLSEMKADKKSFNISFGMGKTTFDGNRGLAYEDLGPMYHIGAQYFIYDQTAFSFGLEYSKHRMNIDTHVAGSPSEILGSVETTFKKPFIGIKHYLGANLLGSTFEYWKPFLSGRFEYWMQENKFIDRDNISSQSGNSLGSSIGAGFDLPIKKNETSVSFEFQYHVANLFDEKTKDYRQLSPNEEMIDQNGKRLQSDYGHNDLSGNSISLVFAYNVAI